MKKLIIFNVLLYSLLQLCNAFPSIGGVSIEIPDNPVSDYLSIAQDIKEAMEVFAEGYTPEQEYFLGRVCAANILYKYNDKFTTNEALQKYINEIGQTLSVLSDREDLFSGYIFIVVEGENKNAIATPGGFIFITTAMIEACDNEDQIAGILAHEIGHVVHKDAVNSIDSKNRLISLIKLAEKYGGPAAKAKAQEALAKLPDWFVVEIEDITMDDIFSSIVEGLVNQWEKSYSKDQEKAADIHAVELMIKTGYNPNELINIINKLDSGTDAHYTSHPSPSERVAYISEEITKYGEIASTLEIRVDRIVE